MSEQNLFINRSRNKVSQSPKIFSFERRNGFYSVTFMMKKQMKRVMVAALMASLVLPMSVSASEAAPGVTNVQETEEASMGEGTTQSISTEENQGEEQKQEEQEQIEETNTEETNTEEKEQQSQEAGEEGQESREQEATGTEETASEETISEDEQLQDTDEKDVPVKDAEVLQDGKTEEIAAASEEGTLVPEEYLLEADGNDLVLERTEDVETQSGSDEIVVQAVAGHGTIESDPLQENATVSNNKKIILKFKLRSYGNSIDDFTIMIYKKGSQQPLAKSVGTFSETKGYKDYYFTWDTTNVNKYTPGTYEVLCYSSYVAANGKTQLNEKYTYNINLEDYKLTASREFVTRLYQKVLGRQPDANGLQNWTNALYYKWKTGAQVASQFIFSSEFINKKLSDEEYVKVLYRSILGREAETGGLAVWINALDAGMTRWGVLKGFIASREFDSLCREYGIDKGKIDTNDNRDINAGATSFVGRIYSIALGRKADVNGLNYWTGRIVNKQDTPAKVAKGFIFSREFTSKNLSDEEYIKVLYKVLMNRQADKPGMNYWANQLKTKQKTREEVFNGFAGSKEFKSLIASYNL